MNCKKCGNENDKKATICPNCGEKLKKPIFKKWWFWVLIVLICLVLGASAGGTDDNSSSTNNNVNTTENTTQSTTQISSDTETKTYEKIELQTMIDDLNDNALKAEKKYNNKYVEVTGRITNFDSSGSYISIESENAGDFNLDTVICKTSNAEQLNVLMEKSTGDIVTIKGKVISIGEVLGYSIKIDEIVK